MSSQALAAPVADSTSLTGLPVAIAEELMLLDRRTGENVRVAGPLADALAPWARPSGETDRPASTITLAARATADLAELRRRLLQTRRAAAAVAAEHGANLAAVGAAPVSAPAGDRDGPDQAVCGLVVHVGVPDGQIAVRVCRRLEAWLPVVRAMTVNSPFHLGADTGLASWRFVQLQRRALGAFGQRRRFAAGLLRAAAAAAAAVDGVRAGLPEILLDPEAVRAGHWQAARAGLAGRLTDPHGGRPRPARQLLDELFAALPPVLSAGGDLDLMRAGLARLGSEGTGADRQRRITDRAGDLPSGLSVLSRLTTAG